MTSEHEPDEPTIDEHDDPGDSDIQLDDPDLLDDDYDDDYGEDDE